MSEQWENLIEQEIYFYLNFKEYEAEIQDQIKEVDDWIEFPVTKYDSELGRIHRSCPGTETQAIRRIEKRDSLNALLKRAHNRINRLFEAYNQLNEEEQEILDLIYFDKDYYLESNIVRLLGFENKKALHRAKSDVLEKMYRIYKGQRELIRLEERKKKAKILQDWVEERRRKLG